MAGSKILRNKRGMIFFVTLIGLALMIITGTTIYRFASGNLYTANYLRKSVQARYLAEAGLAEAFSVLKNNWSDWSDVSKFPLTSLGSGTFDASVTKVGSRYLVSSTGSVQDVSVTATAEVIPPPATSSAWDYAIASGGAGAFDSGTADSPGQINGKVYAGGSLTLDGASNGPKLTITGDAQAAGSLTENSSVDTQAASTPNYSGTVAFPTADLTYYYNIAYANRASGVTYYSGDTTFDAGQLAANPPGGVIYVNGKCTIHGLQSTTACIVATDSLSIEKSGSTYPKVTINQFTSGSLGYPAFICAGAMSFRSTGNGDAYLITNGLVYVGGSFTYNNGNHGVLTMTGPIEVKGSLSISPTAMSTTTITWASCNAPGFNNPGGGSGTMTIASYNK